MFLKALQNSQENTYTKVSFLINLYTSGLQLYRKETQAQVFSGEFYEIFKNIFFSEHDLMGSRVNNISEPFLKKKNISFCLDELVFKAHIQTIILVLFLITK